MGRLTKLEYLELRCKLNEAVLLGLGRLVAAYVPAIYPHLERIGKDWDKSINNLEEMVSCSSED